MTLFDMFNKAAGLTEDAKKYNTGDISEKTGLQKQPDGSWKPPKAKGSQPKDMTYKEAAPKLNEKQKELISNMAKQNGKSVEEVFETFKDIIGFGKEQDPKLAEELDRNTRFEQEKLAKKRQKEEEELRQQRQEGEAAARAFKEKVEKGEIVYNEKTGQFEDAPQKSKPLTRTEATERVFQNHIKEFKDIKKQYSKLPRKELERVYSQKVSRTNSVETLPKGEIAEALTQHEMASKYSSEIRELRQGNSTPEKKEEKTSYINPHEEVKEHLNASKYYKQKAKGFTKTDPSYKKYLAKAEEYENKAKAAADDYGLDFSEFIDDSAPLTADTKIKLSQIKTTKGK